MGGFTQYVFSDALDHALLFDPFLLFITVLCEFSVRFHLGKKLFRVFGANGILSQVLQGQLLNDTRAV